MQLASWYPESITTLGKCLGTRNSAEMSLDISTAKRRPSQAQPLVKLHQVVKPFPVATKKELQFHSLQFFKVAAGVFNPFIGSTVHQTSKWVVWNISSRLLPSNPVNPSGPERLIDPCLLADCQKKMFLALKLKNASEERNGDEDALLATFAVKFSVILTAA